MLSRFYIIAAIDDDNGIGKNNSIPWKDPADMKQFRLTTTGDGNNAVIMGKNTYLSIGKPLPNRLNIVITSSTVKGEDIIICKSLFSALNITTKYKEVYIIGGSKLYEEAIRKFGYLCDKVLITRIKGNYDCDVFFPIKLLDKNLQIINKVHPEEQYLNILKRILTEGDKREDRTKVGTKSIFGVTTEWNLLQGFPLLTTKQVWFKAIVEELLLFISGKTDTKILEAKGVNIWKGNTSKDFLESRNLCFREGDLGASYPHQWRHCGAEYNGCDKDYTNSGIDQLQNVVNSIKNDPYNRRHIISSWDVCNIHLMALPPCHCLVQFFVGNEDDKPTYLDCSMYQRSGDMFLGVPFNIASYALLMEIIASVTGLIARKFVHTIGDAHIYLDHIEQVTEQITRVPYPLCKIEVDCKDINNVAPTNIKLLNYRSHQKIKGEMAK